MKFIVDTNIIFSGIYDLESNAGKVLLLATEEKIELFSPEYVKQELIQILQKKLKFTVIEVFDIILALPMKWIEAEIFEDGVELAAGLISHKKDIPVLACALALGIDILSGDKHFQNIKIKKIKIWKLREAVETIK